MRILEDDDEVTVKLMNGVGRSSASAGLQPLTTTTRPPKKKQKKYGAAAGYFRYQSDKRQIGGLLLLTGTCAFVQPLFSTAAVIDGETGTTPTEVGVPRFALIGGLCVAVTGMLSILVGYLQVVHDGGFRLLTGFCLLFVQTAWIPYISNMVGVGKTMVSGPGFVPEAYNPTSTDTYWIGILGIMGILSYGFGLVGSVAFLQFSLYAYQADKPYDRPASYYRGRLSVYALMLLVAGISQCMLGAYTYYRYQRLILDQGPIQVAFYLIYIPPIAAAVGALQILNGAWGMVRSCGLAACGTWYQWSLGFGWIVQVATQVMTQASWAKGAAGAGLAPTVAAFSVGLSLMPAYLDYKRKVTPEVITPEYYALTDTEEDYDDEDYEEDEAEAPAAAAPVPGPRPLVLPLISPQPGATGIIYPYFHEKPENDTRMDMFASADVSEHEILDV